ncbi:hypothetical protein BD769DRAFT_1672470 [Suillus cothurnatus]|nr:hypothetical protein BD769DRAFT_1672470 [Suillus cothurnatus]
MFWRIICYPSPATSLGASLLSLLYPPAASQPCSSASSVIPPLQPPLAHPSSLSWTYLQQVSCVLACPLLSLPCNLPWRIPPLSPVPTCSESVVFWCTPPLSPVPTCSESVVFWCTPPLSPVPTCSESVVFWPVLCCLSPATSPGASLLSLLYPPAASQSCSGLSSVVSPLQPPLAHLSPLS